MSRSATSSPRARSPWSPCEAGCRSRTPAPSSGGSRHTAPFATASSSTRSTTGRTSPRRADPIARRVRPRPRVFAGGLATETNSFSPIPTGYDDFRRAAAGDSQERRDTIFFGRSFRSYAAVAAERDVDLRIGPYSFATPAGPPARPVYERLRDELLAELDAARPVDGVLLTLHGAMTCEGIDDCESDIVERARELVGGSPAIGVLLDLHCDLPRALLDAADAIVVVKEYPHVDAEPCARRLAEIVTMRSRGARALRWLRSTAAWSASTRRFESRCGASSTTSSARRNASTACSQRRSRTGSF